LTNNQKEEIFSNKFIQNFLENDSKVTLNNKYKFAEIASSLAYYLKSFSNINKLLDYVCLIFKHIFSENIILIMPLNYEGEIWNENIKISVNHEYLTIEEEINSFFNQFYFSKNFKIKEILTFENALINNFSEYKIETKKYYLEVNVEDLFIFLAKIYLASRSLKIVTLISFKIVWLLD